MFDLGEAVDKLQGLFGASGDGDGGAGGNLAELFSNHLDPSLLEGLQVDQLGSALENLGVDPAALTEGQVGEIVQHFSESGSLAGLDLSELLAAEEK